MSTLAALAALPAALLAVWILLRSRVSHGLERTPDATRWRAAPTPLVGGAGIYLGLSVGLWLAVLLGPLTANEQLLGIYTGASLLFLAGLVDDVRTLPPLAKIGAQLAAAGIVLATGTGVELVHAPWLAIPLGLLWLVGMTNAFNLLDNMDGLAGSLAVISAAFFASAAALQSGSRLVLVMSLALAFAVAGFLPFNLRPGRPALAWMGDSGSQLIGFTLASLGLASSYTVATSTVATLVLPVLVLAVPILDTTLVTIVRLLDGRPVSQGGRDHSSHRLVSLGVSETGAVVLLALVSAALGATSLAYEAFGSGRIAALGVLVTFALLVQFGSFLADVDRDPHRTGAPLPLHAPPGRGRRRRRADRGVVSRCIPAAIRRHRHAEPASLLPADTARASLLPLCGAAADRYVRRSLALRELARRAAGSVCGRRLGGRRAGIVVLTHGELGDFSRSVFVIDALICTVAIVGARFAERAIVRGIELARSGEGRRVLIVGAGRTGRSMLRELRETPGERVVASSTTIRGCEAGG